MRSYVIAALIAVPAAMVACTAMLGYGDLEVREDGAAASGAVGGTGGTGGTGAAGAGTTTSSGGEGGTAGTGGQGATAGTGGTAGSGGTGGQGGQPPLPEVPCGSDTCTGGEICCVTLPPNSFVGCGAPGSCGMGEFEVPCDGPEDCSVGEVCCGVWNNGYLQIQCVPNCSDYLMCGGPGAPHDEYCTAPQVCNPSTNLPGYYACW